jgi:two-component system sensor histidine kinase CpxA
VGKLFLRVFLSFWIATVLLLMTLAAGIVLLRPDALASWRTVGQQGMIFVGSMAADRLETVGEAAGTSVLTQFTRKSQLPAWLYRVDGKPLCGQGAPAGQEALVNRAVRSAGVEHTPLESDVLLARPVQSSTGELYVVVWRVPLLLPMSMVPVPARSFGVRLVLVIVVAGVVCWWLTRRFLLPLRRLQTAARSYSQGDLSLRVAGQPEFRHEDEFSELARDLDEMAARIDDLMRSQQRFLADISHELRSPLARLSLALELAKRKRGDGVVEHVRMEREIQRLDSLIQQLLTLGRLQGQDRSSTAQWVDVCGLVREVVEDADFEAQEAGKRVVIARDCPAVAEGNPEMLRGAIENVIRNAVRYAPASSEVAVALASDVRTGEISISVSDRGPGVPAAAIGRIFDPFFRVEEARDRDSGGAGLGLAIAQQAMRMHGGSAHAENLPEGGLRVTLALRSSA